MRIASDGIGGHVQSLPISTILLCLLLNTRMRNDTKQRPIQGRTYIVTQVQICYFLFIFSRGLAGSISGTGVYS